MVKRGTGTTLEVLAGLILALTGCSAASTADRIAPAQSVIPESAPNSTPPVAIFNEPQVPVPKHGEEVWLTESDALKRDCEASLKKGRYGTLRITVPRGPEAFFVKLVEAPTAAFDKYVPAGTLDVTGVSIAPGKSITIDVPLCGNASMDYDLYYAAGTRWYGYHYLFGPDGAY